MEDESAPVRPRSLGRVLNFATVETNTLCNAMLARHGLTLPQWVVLSALWQRDGLSVSEIAAYTGNAGPATSRILDRMVERGLVERRADPRDRRAQRVFLCSTGTALSHLARFWDDINRMLLKGLDAKEEGALFALLERVTGNARAALRPVDDGGTGEAGGGDSGAAP